MAEEAKEDDLEYESDPEESRLSLKMRRREASDDEEEDEGRDVEDGEGREKPKPPKGVVDSDTESDSQGGAAGYDDADEDEEYVEDHEDDEEYVDEEEEEYEERGGEVEGSAMDVMDARKFRGNEVIGAESTVGLNDERSDGKIDNDNVQIEEEYEKKENEPYAVPTAGAFYMHDDRFRGNAGGRHRRTFGGRKLWESKDDRKWGHDKFEELSMQERHYEQGRKSSSGRYRGNGRNRGPEQGHVQGSRPRAYNSNRNPSNNNIHSGASKTVRGRGPIRYQPSFKQTNEVLPAQHHRSGRAVGKPSHSSSARMSAHISSVESEAVPTKKHVFASSLNSASPPFYPSTSSSKERNLTQKRNVQTGASNRKVHPTVVDECLPIAQSSAMRRGKSVVDSLDMDKLYIDNSIPAVAGKPSATLHIPPGSSSITSAQSLQLKAQGRGINALAQMTYQTVSNNQNNRGATSQLHTLQRAPVQTQAQSSTQSSAQQSASGSQVSSPPRTVLSKSSLEPGEVESPLESSKSKTASVSKGKGTLQGSGRGSFLYGGAQVMGTPGNMGGGPGDPNFPAFLPVMQFGGQHPGGIGGVPAVGMAFPGYVGQPQHGLGNSEMTWLPVLAGAAGALGATYCSPYISVDGAYHPRASGQTFPLAPTSIKENNTSKPNNEWEPMQRTEVANDDFGQRQKNPRRYTEMKFDQ